MASQLELYLASQNGYLGTVLPQLVSTTTLAAPAATVTYTVTVPYNRIWCVWRANSSNASTVQSLEARINGAATSSYLWQDFQANNATLTGASSGALTTSMILGTVTGTTSTANFFSSGDFLIDGANQSATYVTAQGKSGNFITATNTNLGVFTSQYDVLGVVTSVTLLLSAGNFVAGSQFSFYGLN